MTSAAEKRTSGVWDFDLKGTHYAGPVLDRTAYADVLCMLTADEKVVGSRLPSPQLHPLRWTPGRALVDVFCADWDLSVGGSTPVRYLEMGVEAWVTYGPKPALPVAPAAQALGVVKRSRWDVGAYMLTTVVTDPDIAELYRTVLGFSAVTGDVTHEVGKSWDRWVMSLDGQPVLDLQVRTDSKARHVEADLVDYAVINQELHRTTLHASGQTQSGFGKRTARLAWGAHPRAQQLQQLRLGRGPVFLAVDETAQLTVHPPVTLGAPASHPS